MTSGAVTFNQAALVAALESSPQQLDDMLHEFDRRRLRVFERINAMPGMRCLRPTGAFYCFPNVTDTFKKLGVGGSAEFATRLIEEARVAAVPGIAFGMDEHMRFSFATSMDRIDEGLDRIQKFLA